MDQKEYVVVEANEPLPPESDPTMEWKLIGGVASVVLAILIVMLLIYIVGARNDLKMERWHNRN